MSPVLKGPRANPVSLCLFALALGMASTSRAEPARDCADTSRVGNGVLIGASVGGALALGGWLAWNPDDSASWIAPALVLTGGATGALLGSQVGAFAYGAQTPCGPATVQLRIVVGLASALIASGGTTLLALAAGEEVGATAGAVLGPALVLGTGRSLDGRGSLPGSLAAALAGAGTGALLYMQVRPGEHGWNEVALALVPALASLATLVAHELTHAPPPATPSYTLGVTVLRDGAHLGVLGTF